MGRNGTLGAKTPRENLATERGGKNTMIYFSQRDGTVNIFFHHGRGRYVQYFATGRDGKHVISRRDGTAKIVVCDGTGRSTLLFMTGRDGIATRAM